MKDILTLKDFISPLSEAEFLKQHWSENFFFLPKGIKKVNTLFSWDRVNEILSSCKLPFPRLRLIASNVPVKKELYYLNDKIFGSSSSFENLDTEKVSQLLQCGASLVLNGVEEIDTQLRDVCLDLGKKFHNHTVVNAYLAFKDKNGFNLHWDDHETLIVQVEGKKHWKVFGASRIHPLRNDIEGNLIPPDCEPLFDKVIEQGDVLHIPRGFWHVATPVNEPSLHLTFGVEPLIGFNWIQSIIENCLQHTIIRENIPIFSDESSIEKFQTEIKNVLLKEIDKANIETFISSANKKNRNATKFSLPTSITS